jgi:NAD(P) transhydrogenase subunit alpha
VLGHADPYAGDASLMQLAERGVTLLAIELLPRITKAQPMDALSSQANLGGYKAVLRAADQLPRIFPLMMTAAGTIRPARVFVVGAGVAGLQAIATARRLGALVSAIDVRPEVKEQVESLGAKFVEPGQTASGEGGYAGEQSEQQQQQQKQLMAETVADSDVVITTASIPGKKAPELVTEEMTRSMRRGSVIVDLAAERGGNCALTQPGEVRDVDGVCVDGTPNLPSLLAHDASSMYANNLTKLIEHLVTEQGIKLDPEDEIASAVILTRDGDVVNNSVREGLGLAASPDNEETAELTPPHAARETDGHENEKGQTS